MPTTAQIIYQPYVTSARGTLKPGVAVVCRTAAEGLRRAEKAMAGGSIVGARIVQVTHDGDADEFGAPVHLGEFGRVPEEA